VARKRNCVVIFCRFSTMHKHNRQTDRQTDRWINRQTDRPWNGNIDSNEQNHLSPNDETFRSLSNTADHVQGCHSHTQIDMNHQAELPIKSAKQNYPLSRLCRLRSRYSIEEKTSSDLSYSATEVHANCLSAAPSSKQQSTLNLHNVSSNHSNSPIKLGKQLL